ncbi:MAG: prenyltransferase/squalene oxidase repeat-containing protein [Bacillota bacterium]
MGNWEAGLPALAVDAEGARAYVLAHGGARERARLEGIFGRGEPDRAAVRELELLQNPDGGFPLMQEAGRPSSIDTTCYLLAQMKDIPPLAGSPMASRALAFLRRTQEPDGSWVESPAVAALSPIRAGGDDPRARAYLTALASYNLLTLEPEHQDPITRGSRWLRMELGRFGEGEKAFHQTLFLAAAVWSKVVGPNASEKAWAYDLLSHRELEPPTLAWWLATVAEIGVEARYFGLVLRMLNRLAAMQREDGSFPAEEGFALESTLTALRVFRGFRLI